MQGLKDISILISCLENEGAKYVNFYIRKNNTALHFAILNNNLEAVRVLLEYGADPNSPTTNKNAVILAVESRQLPIL
jgi:ankyrin repeat protein